MAAYYNEIDLFCVEWLKNLIAAKLIAAGDVDSRSITEVTADDVKGYTQCHFFAGIAGWSYALRLAGVSDDQQAWTGSCPCQPFSNAGKGKGFDDERHLWPEFARLIGDCKPPIVFGEQVASKAGREWLSVVRSDLEALGYAVGAADLCAASVGAPHIRQRLWWAAYAGDARLSPRERQILSREKRDDEGRTVKQRGEAPSGAVVDATSEQVGLSGRAREQGSAAGGLGDTGREGRRQVRKDARGRGERSGTQGLAERSLHERDGHPWADLEWVPCIDGKARPTKSGLFPLAHGIPGRVGKLRAYGNAIVPQVAAEFIAAAMEYAP